MGIAPGSMVSALLIGAIKACQEALAAVLPCTSVVSAVEPTRRRSP